MAKVDRRGRQRIPAEFKVDCIQGKDYIISYSRDISVDGMFIHTKNPPEVGQRVVLYVSTGGVERLEVPARVVWVNRTGKAKDFGMGVKFVKLKKSVKQDILHAVKKVAILEVSAQKTGGA